MPRSARPSAGMTTRPASSPRIRRRASGASWRSSSPASSARRASASAPSDGYLQALDGMVFGDDPSEGFVRGREFLHPRLAIAFRVPREFPPGEHQGSGARRGRRRHRDALRRRDGRGRARRRRSTSPPAGSTGWSRARSRRRRSTACRRRPPRRRPATGCFASARSASATACTG